MDNGRTDLSKFDNSWYDHGGSGMKVALWQLVSIIFFLNHFSVLSGLKVTLLKMFGARMGRGIVIKQRVKIKYPWLLEVGDHVWIGEEVWIENHAQVTIGKNSCISQGAMLLCGNHDYKKTTFDLMAQPVTLEEGVWIGAYAVVCPGTTCRSHSVLTVKSVGSGTLEPYSIYKGNPATKVKDRTIN